VGPRDYDLLLSAKRAELMNAGVSDPSPAAVHKAISKDELACHYRRQTRRATNTTNLIEVLLLAMSSATDALGVQLFSEDMMNIWEEQKKHLVCLQDPQVFYFTPIVEA